MRSAIGRATALLEQKGQKVGTHRDSNRVIGQCRVVRGREEGRSASTAASATAEGYGRRDGAMRVPDSVVT